MGSDSFVSSIRLSLTSAQARAVLHAIKNMEGDDNADLVELLDRAEDKIRSALRKAAK